MSAPAKAGITALVVSTERVTNIIRNLFAKVAYVFPSRNMSSYNSRYTLSRSVVREAYVSNSETLGSNVDVHAMGLAAVVLTGSTFSLGALMGSGLPMVVAGGGVDVKLHQSSLFFAGMELRLLNATFSAGTNVTVGAGANLTLYSTAGALGAPVGVYSFASLSVVAGGTLRVWNASVVIGGSSSSSSGVASRVSMMSGSAMEIDQQVTFAAHSSLSLHAATLRGISTNPNVVSTLLTAAASNCSVSGAVVVVGMTSVQVGGDLLLTNGSSFNATTTATTLSSSTASLMVLGGGKLRVPPTAHARLLSACWVAAGGNVELQPNSVLITTNNGVCDNRGSTVIDSGATLRIASGNVAFRILGVLAGTGMLSVESNTATLLPPLYTTAALMLSVTSGGVIVYSSISGVYQCGRVSVRAGGEMRVAHSPSGSSDHAGALVKAGQLLLQGGVVTVGYNNTLMVSLNSTGSSSLFHFVSGTVQGAGTINVVTGNPIPTPTHTSFFTRC